MFTRWARQRPRARSTIAPPGGTVICTSQCGVGGKAASIDLDGSFTLNIVLGADYAGTGSSIRVYRWNQLPNTSRTGMLLLTTVTAPGSFSFTRDSTYQWVSFFAQNPIKSNYWDGLCFTYNSATGTITVGGFS